jgi:dihydrofolate reductase
MRVSLIAAAGANGVIGRRSALPWHLPADLRHFKQLTLGHHLILGRKTWEAVGKPLPGRRTIVVTRRPDYALPDGVERAASIEEALARAERQGEDEAFVAGGAEIYRASLPRADRIYLTRIHHDFAGDASFPDLDPEQWRLASRQDHPADAQNPYAFSFLTYDKRASGAP